MPAFQKLMVGAAERLAKRQAELDELQKAAAKRIELEAAANSFFEQPNVAPEGPLTLLHGTAHKFDRFDFENNLRRGEGALAYGPGGYMTGHEPLARDYAKNIYAKLAGEDSAALSHLGIKEALRTDPKAAAEYLRALNVGKTLGRTPFGGTFFGMTENLPPHLKGREGGKGIHRMHTLTSPSEYFVVERTRALRDLDKYLDAYSNLKMNGVDRLPTRIGRGGISPLEVVRLGREMRKVMSAAGNPEPKLVERLKVVDPERIREAAPESYRDFTDGKGYLYKLLSDFTYNDPDAMQAIGNASRVDLPGFDKIRANLNATNRVTAGRPGRANYHASMMPGGIIDMRAPRMPGESQSAYERRLYKAQIDAQLSEMLAYDYPLAAHSPRTVGALAQLAEQRGFIDEMKPSMLGKDFLSRLKGSDRANMEALRDAGIPATFYLRGGRRDKLPDRIDPSDFNFVIHDQRRLSDPEVEPFRTGGAV